MTRGLDRNMQAITINIYLRLAILYYIYIDELEVLMTGCSQRCKLWTMVESKGHA